MSRQRFVSSDSLIAMVERKIQDSPHPNLKHNMAKVREALHEYQIERDYLLEDGHDIPVNL